MKENRTDLKDWLETDDDFLEFLEQEAQSDNYKSLKKEAEAGPHPTEDMLYDYVLDVLDHNAAKAVRNHILFCGECARELLRIRLIEEASENAFLSWLDTPCLSDRLKNWVFRFRKLLVSGLCVATVSGIIVFHIFPSLPRLISKSYETAFIENIRFSPDDLRKRPVLPWQEPGRYYGFASSDRYAPANRAFGAGLWQGSQAMTKGEKALTLPEFFSPGWQGSGDHMEEDEWPDTPWAVYYSLGRWCFLVQAVSLSDEEIPHEFWEKQRKILGEMRKAFYNLPDTFKDKRADKIIEKVLARIESDLKTPEGTFPGKKKRQAIAFQTEHLIKYLSPRHIPQREKE
ncbi:hypothetical protein [Desulfonema magnum]|uniref:Zinc-finger domain-containing protein n=1 Tax=Desulfonema magnum TaxID=45655 RepID=A0A975GMX9_9BACT|nr:hypothetical protein [Desulfonema magnum]QTA86293.1 Uncharacterized protein dnm_023140 [Desulfonema magnum]